ncbi:hypothetical protein ACIGXI_26275 [Kitasatospora aureofaciens]|uniref:hypothetical protein n=1 Tax=Kitasatospora aureofaciens TaxID=1894 RepID=UPI0037CC6F2B
MGGGPGRAERWYARTSTGTKGCILPATFQAKGGGGSVVFEGSVNDDALSPEKDALEQILNGIEQAGSSSSTCHLGPA